MQEKPILLRENNETFNMKSLTIMNFKGEKLKSPFPYFVNYSEGNMVKAIESLNAQLERFYYEATFGL